MTPIVQIREISNPEGGTALLVERRKWWYRRGNWDVMGICETIDDALGLAIKAKRGVRRYLIKEEAE